MSDEQFEPRRAEPNAQFTTTRKDGTEITMKADAHGVVQPTSFEQVQLADSFGLPVARKVLRERAKAEAAQDQAPGGGTAKAEPITAVGPSAEKGA